MKWLLIDGDDLVWRVAATALSPQSIQGELTRRIDHLSQALQGDRLVFALSDRANWRKSLWPGYKAHRAGRRRPPLLHSTRATLQAGWRTRCEPALEADDVLGLAATDPLFLDRRSPPEPEAVKALRVERAIESLGETVIVSRDKDLLTVPGLHGAPSGHIRRVTRDEAAFNHLALALAGDPADGFKGCPGVGPVKARRVLTKARADGVEPWRAVVGAYAAAGLSEQDALLQARLARVLRAGELDAMGQPVLWTPP